MNILKTRMATLLVAVLFSYLAGSCKDLIETDMTNSQVTIRSPKDSLVSNTYQVSFLWDKTDGAQQYRIQIATPSFDNITSVVADTLVTGESYSYVLFPGKYQWRIRAENSYSRSQYVQRSIFIDTTTNLSGQSFSPDYPINNFLTNNAVVTFSWKAYPYATDYRVLIYNSTISREKLITAISLKDTLPEGSFYWKVRAENRNNGTVSDYSTPRLLEVDNTPPLASAPKTPLNGATVLNPITLSWARALSVITDSLFISQDSTFTGPYIKILSTSDTFSNLSNLTVNETYFWRLRSKDNAGNWSTGYSNAYKFTVSL